ncbi:MAG: hypothetical protein OXC06_14715, partial [Acidimicrobiaceae bacterium]|nr:hypothetical protein [Acidimicrobiaceae bacterium]
YSVAVETVTLVDLAPILAAVMGPMLLFAAAMMRYQHVDSTKTRDLIDEARKENRDLIDEVRKENRDLIDEVRKENRDLIDKSHGELGASLGDLRERLARIEGHLRIWPPPPGDADAGGAEAA